MRELSHLRVELASYAELLEHIACGECATTYCNKALPLVDCELPILELRGGIIAGFAMNMEWLPTFIIAYIGNILPIPFILLFIRYIFKVLKKTPMRKVVEWCERRADQKRKPPASCTLLPIRSVSICQPFQSSRSNGSAMEQTGNSAVSSS